MDWRNAAADFPPLEEKDIAFLQLSKEEKEQVLTLFNRAVSNAQSDSADIAMIALKKLLTQYPSWGEAALLYGVCLAIDGRYKRAAASFEHAVSVGLKTEELTYMAQVYNRDAVTEFAQERKHAQGDDEVVRKGLLTSLFSSKMKRSSVYSEIDTEERGHMQAPILTRVPRSSGKAKLATDRERRDVMMQSGAPKNDSLDEEIDVSIPKTPAEKLRITTIALGGILLAILLGLAIWFLIIPAVSTYRENSSASAKLKYLLASMEAQKSDPLVSQILSDYEKAYPSASIYTHNAPAGSTRTTTIPQKETTVPVQGSSAAITPTTQAGTQMGAAATPEASVSLGESSGPAGTTSPTTN